MKDGFITVQKSINKMDELVRMRGEMMAVKVRQRGNEVFGQLARFIHDDADINEAEGVNGMDLNLDPKVFIDVLAKDFGD